MPFSPIRFVAAFVLILCAVALVFRGQWAAGILFVAVAVIGEIAVWLTPKNVKEKGYLNPKQLDEAVKIQQQTKEPDLGQVLLSLGFDSEREVLQAKAQEMGLAFIDLDRVTIESSALHVVPERIAKAHNVIPVKKDGETLYLAMANDKNIMALDDVKMASGCRVVPVLAVPGAIEDAIKRSYSGGN